MRTPMRNMLLFVYYLSAYSIGLATLIASFSLLREAAGTAWFFISTLAMTMTVLLGTIQNFAGPAPGNGAATALTLANYLTAAVFSVASGRFFSALLPWRGSRIADAIILAAMASLYALTAADLLAGGRGLWPILLLAAKDAVCLYWAVLALAGRRRAADPFRNFSWRISIACLFALPFMLMTEIPRLGPPELNHALGLQGPWLLPAIYLVWCLVFLLSRGARKPVASSPKDEPEALADYSGGLGISQREKEVMELLLSGKSYKEIMGVLSISMPTVKTHVSSLYRKTGASNRLDLARRAGLLPHTKE